MIDFAELSRRMDAERRMTPEQRAEREAAELAKEIANDEALRDEKSTKRVVLTLEEDPEGRSNSYGERTILFRGREDGRADVKAVLFAEPSYMTGSSKTAQELAEKAADKLRSVGAGDKVTFAGQWKPRNWKDRDGAWHKTFEFHAQRFEKGDVPLEALRSKPLTALRAQAAEQSKLVDRTAASADLSRYSRGPNTELPVDPRMLKTREGR